MLLVTELPPDFPVTVSAGYLVFVPRQTRLSCDCECRVSGIYTQNEGDSVLPGGAAPLHIEMARASM